MSGVDPKEKGKMVDEHDVKNKGEKIVDDKKGEKTIDSRCSKRDGKKRCIKKIVYYETDSSTSSSPLGKEETTSGHHEQKWLNLNSIALNLIIRVFLAIQIPNCFLFLLVSLLTLMGRIILGGVTKCVVIFFFTPLLHLVHCRNGMHIPDVDDESYNEVEVEESVHRNSQATTVLLASLYREQYNKVNGLENAKKLGHIENHARSKLDDRSH
jgi:hypothetical protein